MRFFIGSLQVLFVSFCMVGLAGCSETKTDTSASSHAHGEDGHQHGEDGHHHDEHGNHIDADAAGLSTDDLVSLDGPELPDNFNDAVAALAKMSTTISDGFKNDKIDDAHGPLHDVGNMLECVGELANKSEMSDDAKKAVADAVEQLFDGFGAIDMKLHDPNKGKDYADVADSIEAAMKTLLDNAKQ